MLPTLQFTVLLLGTGLALAATPAPQAEPTSPKQALRAFQDLIGIWRAAGNPEGTLADKQKGFWTETIAWEWQFKGKEVWLKAEFQKGKFLSAAELRYLPESKQYQLTATTADKQTQTFLGSFTDRRLVVERTDKATQETHRLVFTLLHANRFLYRYEVRAEGKPLFATRYQVGATKEGVPFATAGSVQPECVVSGGLGTSPVMFMGKTYYVCCSGCRDAFRDEPEKYVREFEEANAKKRKGDGK